jgi:hypothetical protein
LRKWGGNSTTKVNKATQARAKRTVRGSFELVELNSAFEKAVLHL